MNNILSSQCEFNDAFNNKDSKDLDKLARQVNNKHVKGNNNNLNKFNGIVCDQLSCSPYSQQSINQNQNYSFFSTQGDFSSTPPISSVNDQLFSDSSSNGSTFDNVSKKIYANKKVFSESESFQSLSSDQFDNNSLSSTYSSLPLKIKKHLKLESPHMKKYTDTDNDKAVSHLKTCDECKNQLIALLSSNNIINPNILQSQNQHNSRNFKPIQNNTFLNLINPEIKDIFVLILIGIIIIMFIDIFIRNQ
jgi:hypothetical protein